MGSPAPGADNTAVANAASDMTGDSHSPPDYAGCHGTLREGARRRHALDRRQRVVDYLADTSPLGPVKR